jgi:hypothetical protein
LGGMAKAGGPVIAHSLAQALAAAEAASEASVGLELLSAPGCGHAAGTGWFRALGDLVVEKYPGLPVKMTLDCADDAGIALGALRSGLKSIVFTGKLSAATRLDDIAVRSGAVIHRQRPDAVDLIATRDPKAACIRWFSSPSLS